jgi:hypothetical protein
MTDEVPTLDQLLVDPELAVLHALGAALAAAQRALLAAHPELEDDDFAGERALKLSGAGWIADGILTQVTGLELSLQRYRREVARSRAAPLPDDPF